MIVTFTEVVVLIFIVAWIISEMIIVKSIKNEKKDESLWLAVNIILPIVGCIIYKLSHRQTSEQ